MPNQKPTPEQLDRIIAFLERKMRESEKERVAIIAELPTEQELSSYRSIAYWSAKLNIPEGVLTERLADYEPEYFRAPDPDNTAAQVALPAYPVDVVCRLCADLLGPPLFNPSAPG